MTKEEREKEEVGSFLCGLSSWTGCLDIGRDEIGEEIERRNQAEPKLSESEEAFEFYFLLVTLLFSFICYSLFGFNCVFLFLLFNFIFGLGSTAHRL